jgi:hypothetical protein
MMISPVPGSLTSAKTSWLIISSLDGHLVQHAPIGRLDKAVIVDATIGRQRPMRPMFGPSGVSMGQMRP